MNWPNRVRAPKEEAEQAFFDSLCDNGRDDIAAALCEVKDGVTYLAAALSAACAAKEKAGHDAEIAQ